MRKVSTFKMMNGEMVLYIESEDIPPTLIVYKEGEKTKLYTQEHALKKLEHYRKIIEWSRYYQELNGED